MNRRFVLVILRIGTGVDLSDYERAVDYRDALNHYYKNQKAMAGRLEVSEAWLSRYLDLAALPEEVVAAFGDVTELKTETWP